MFVSIMTLLVLTAAALIALLVLALPLLLLTWGISVTLGIISELLAEDTDIP